MAGDEENKNNTTRGLRSRLVVGGKNNPNAHLMVQKMNSCRQDQPRPFLTTKRRDYYDHHQRMLSNQGAPPRPTRFSPFLLPC
jgi:hypothetical protein